MADKNGYLSRVTYKGGKDSYEFPFSYLRKDFVKAQIDVSEHESITLAYLVDYTINGHTIELKKPVDADKTITIYRETSSTPLVEYEDSSILRAYDLNLSQRQNLNILEEQTDSVEKNYSLSQDTKDYMYKNLMDTKTAIDNKMSETLDTVNASVSTMNDIVNTTKKSVEDSLATTTTNLNDAIDTATSSMDNKIAQTSQALEDAKANLETTKSAMEKALADTQDSLKDTENRVNETKADITKLVNEFKESESSLQDAIKTINTTNRNMSYEVGDQIHSSYLPFNCYITCVTAGTTGDTLPVIPEGDHDSGFTYMDGTATFKMDYMPLSINGKKPLNKAGDITVSALATPRKIGGVSFDGTADIDLPGVNAAGNQDTTGNAATATKLATPRKIELTGNVTGSATFDGTSDVSINTTVNESKHAVEANTAATATKATQDSAGQQINTTYIKGLSISSNTIIYTKGNGTTGTITVPTGAGIKSYITESVVNSDGSWYRKYSDGWVEQGGYNNIPNLNLLKPYKNTNYTVIFNGDFGNAGGSIAEVFARTKTNTSITVHAYWVASAVSTPYSGGYYWYACGQGA